MDLKTWVTILRSFNLFYVPKTNHWQPIIMAMPIRRVKLFDKIDLFLGWYQIFVYVHLCVESFGRNQLSFIRFHSKIIYKNAIECIAIKYFTRTCHRTRTGRGLLYITFQNETHLHTMGNQIKMINTGIGHFIALAYQNGMDCCWTHYYHYYYCHLFHFIRFDGGWEKKSHEYKLTESYSKKCETKKKV